MDSIFSDIVNYIVTSVGIIGLLSAAFMVGMYKHKVGINKEGIKENKESIKEIGNKIDTVSKKLDGLSMIKTFVENFVSGKGWSYFDKSSPIELNKKGKTVSENIGARKILERLYTPLSEKVKMKNLNNPYDIQRVCFDVCENIDTSELLTEEELIHIKNYAYHIGENVKGFSAIFALELRNMMFEKEGYSTKDIDQHDLAITAS